MSLRVLRKLVPEAEQRLKAMIITALCFDRHPKSFDEVFGECDTSMLPEPPRYGPNPFGPRLVVMEIMKGMIARREISEQWVGGMAVYEIDLELCQRIA